jgi:membrane associated rhomboid family serine protease
MIPLKDVIRSRTRPVVTVALIAVNAMVFGLQRMLPSPDLDRFFATFGLVPADFSLASLFTSMFVHGGAAHLGGNLLFLWIFGDNVEDRLGHARFLAYYLGTGVVAALAQTWMDPNSMTPMVGASGAIAGVLGGYFVLYPNSRVLTLFPFPVMLFEVPAVFFLGLWFVVQFVSGIGAWAAAGGGGMPGGVAFWAHVAGFAAGMALVRVMQRPERQRVEWWSP